jgi:hypothetical protein
MGIMAFVLFWHTFSVVWLDYVLARIYKNNLSYNDTNQVTAKNKEGKQKQPKNLRSARANILAYSHAQERPLIYPTPHRCPPRQTLRQILH